MNATEVVDAISRRYRGGRERLFIVHGNTGDLYPSGDHLRTLPDYLYEALTAGSEAARKAKVWLHYSVGADLRWINGADSTGAARVARVLGTAGEAMVAVERPSPTQFFRMVDDACRLREKLVGRSGDGPVIPLRAVVTEAHTIFPDAQMQFLRPEDRALLIQLQRFAHEPAYDATDTLIVLVADTLSSMHHELRKVAVTLELTRPDAVEAGVALHQAIVRQRAARSDDSADQARCARLAVGLTRRQLECIAAECHVTATELTAAVLDARRKELIARDYGDLLEFIEPAWTLDNVGGCREAKRELAELATALKRGDRDIPSGVIVGGQNGVGKTFLLTGFAGTADVTVAILKPFRASGLGDSERNWDRIATALRSAGQVIVIVQEADAALGQRTGPNVHPVDKAILAQQLALMGDPAYRGTILWMLDTCRPDKLAPDVKRPGRCERMIPLFPPMSADDVHAILAAQVGLLTKKDGYAFAEGFRAGCDDLAIPEELQGKTGAQIERVIRRARKRARAVDVPITPQHLLEVLEKDHLHAEPEAYELQRSIAIAEAVETENADLIPQHFLDQVEQGGGIGPLKERIEVLRRRCDGV